MYQRFIFIISGVLYLSGCTKSGPSVQTYPVTGTVTYNGKAVSGATVGYLSKEAGGYPTSGITDSDGRFSLSTYVGPKQVLRGAAPGDYKVTIVKLRADNKNSTNTTDWQAMSPEERQKMMDKSWEAQRKAEDPQGTGAQAKPKSDIPEKYGKQESSDLTATVVVGENEPRECKLTDD